MRFTYVYLWEHLYRHPEFYPALNNTTGWRFEGVTQRELEWFYESLDRHPWEKSLPHPNLYDELADTWDPIHVRVPITQWV